MAGGVGSRFWPMSTPDFPKQFIDVMGCGKSLIQLTVERFSDLCPIENFWVVTNRKYVDIVKSQLPGIPESNILAEPVARNTAPCIAYACWKIGKRHPDANIVVTPSDALVIDTARFREVMGTALDFTASNDSIVTVGIRPSRPETGYGYICAGDMVSESGICRVDAFREKPDLDTARLYLEAGNYLWNAGIFVWRRATIDREIRKYSPALASLMDEMSRSFYTDGEKEAVEKLFPCCDKVSIDYAVMEKSDTIFTLPAEFGWSDLGSWGSLLSLLPQDANGNAAVGPEIRMHDCHGCIVHTAGMKRVVLEGLEDCIVAERDGSLLVCRLRSEQNIREYSAE